jgi:hypothetical protein
MEDAEQKLLESKMALVAIDQRIERFAQDGGTNIADATKLIGEQTQARNLVELLERSVDALTGGIAAGKADVLLAERECVTAQAGYHQKSLMDLADEFLREHLAALQKLVHQARSAEIFNAATHIGGVASTPTIRDILAGLLLTAASRLPDESFAATSTKQTPIATRQLSENLTSDERARGNAVASNGRDHLIREFTPKPKPAADQFDMAFALDSAREAAHKAEHHRMRAEDCRRNAELHPGDPGWLEQAEQHEREFDRYSAIVERWDNQIEANRAIQ